MSAPAAFRLITIPMSHYCEKARWGLERLGIDYVEERHLQVFHYPRTLWVSRGPNVPVLIDRGAAIADSTAILKHLDGYADAERKLYPQDSELRARVEALEARFDDVLGVESRRWVYHDFQFHPVAALKIAGQGVPTHERVLAPVIFPLLILLVRLLVNPKSRLVAQGLDRIREIVRETDALLAKGERYLLGAQFTAADLALACMISPLVLPRNYGIRLPLPEDMPERAQAVVREFRGTDTGRYVLALFETEKMPGAADKKKPLLGGALS